MIPSALLGGIKARGQLPIYREFQAAILFLDVSGFTRITEAASARGHYGVELVTKVLNRYFAVVHKLLLPLGGEIAKFGGDACLSLIPTQTSEELDLPGLVSSILTETAKLDKRFQREYGFRFQVHGAWGIGKVSLNVVGDPKRHLDYYVSSPALKAVYTLAETSHTGEILGPAITGEILDKSQILEPPSRGTHNTRLFLPADIIRKLNAESRPAELRNAAVLFIKLSCHSGEDISREDFQKAYQRIQSVVTKHLGLINKIDFNEKGYLVLATFGIPFVYGNDTLRAFTAAYRISRLQLEPTQIQIGITYSNIYFGIIGGPRRHEYGILGNAVNIAARLMSYAKPGEVCLSKELIPYLEGQFETAFLASAPVKGIAEPLQIHRLVRMLPTRWGRMEAQFRSDPVFADESAMQAIKLGLASQGEFLGLVKGASGTGKSQLAFKLCEPYLDALPSFQLIQAEAHFRQQRLEIFFLPMRQELGITHFREDFAMIADWFTAQGLTGDLSLLRELLAGVQSTPGRLQLALELILDILVCLFPKGRMLVLENFHNFDHQSRELLTRLIRHKLYQGDKILVSSKEDLPSELREGYRYAELCLDNWDTEVSGKYIRLRVPNITAPAIALLHQICQGNPRFLRGLVLHIQKHWAASKDLITHQIIEDMRARGLLPDDLENLLRADYEALAPDEQLFVRLASIYGRPLRLSEFERLFPDHSFTALSLSSQKLLSSGILRFEPGSEAQVLSFVNPLFADNVYRSILLSEKLATHRAIATHYSSLQSQDEQVWDLIAHHWLKAGDRPKIAWWCAKLARHYYLSGALELSLRMWQQLVLWPVDKKKLTEAELNCAELHLLLADNDKAEAILAKYEHLARIEGIQHDTWVFLRSRLLINRSQYAELDNFLARALPDVSDPVLKDKIATAHCEAILLSMDPVKIEAMALPLWQRLKDENRHLAQNVLAGIIGNYYVNRGDYRKGAAFYMEKLKLARRLKDPVSMRIGLSGLGIAYSRMGNKSKGLDYYQQALELASKSGDRNGFSKVLLDLGVYHRNQGDYDKAADYYRQSLSMAEYIGNKLQISIAIYDMGELFYYQQKFDEAEQLIGRSLVMAQEIGDQVGMSFCYDALGDISYRRKDFPRALQIYRDNLKTQHQLSDMEGKAHSIGNLGNLAKVEKHYARATKLYMEQIRILRLVGDVEDEGRAWFNLATLDIEQGDLPSAREKLNRALDIFQSCNASYYIEQANKLLASI